MNFRLKADKVLLPITALTVSCLTVLLFLIHPPFLRQMDYKVYDGLLSACHEDNATDIPVIVDLDEKSLQQFGQWPWPRYRVALLMGKLQNMGARSIATDVIFAEADNMSLSVLQKQLRRDLQVDVHFSGIPAQLTDNDAILGDLLKQGPFILGMDMDFTRFQDEALSCMTSPCLEHDVPVALLSAPGAMPMDQALHNAQRIICPLSILARNVPATGFITIAADEDGLFRRVPLLISSKGKIYPSLAVAALRQAMGIDTIMVKLSTLGVESIRLGQQEIPVDRKGQMLINYRGAAHTFKYISAADVLNSSVPISDVLGKIVFIGTSASGLRDLRPTPFDTYFPGVETHATVVDNILSGQFIVSPAWGPGAILLAVLLMGLFTFALVALSRGFWIIVPLLGLAIGLWLGSEYLFKHHGLYVSPLYPYINLATSFTLLVVIKFWKEERDKQFIQGAFSHYLAPTIVRKIVDDPGSLSLDGVEKEVTVQFSDIRSFTNLSEKLTPSQVTALLHDYMTPMTEIVTNHSGTLDKFIGDAIMAFWNAPLDVPQHQKLAVNAALTQLDRLGQLNIEFEKLFGFSLKIGIGLHAGVVRVGNMGAENLFDYTIIGDTVNLASRLEGLCKFYGQEIVVSQSIMEACRDAHVFQELDKVRVKGKESAVTIYTVVPPALVTSRHEEMSNHRAGLKAYYDGKFEHALAVFLKLKERHPASLLYTLYCERCFHLKQHPPIDWDGVYTHEKK